MLQKTAASTRSYSPEHNPRTWVCCNLHRSQHSEWKISDLSHAELFNAMSLRLFNAARPSLKRQANTAAGDMPSVFARSPSQLLSHCLPSFALNSFACIPRQTLPSQACSRACRPSFTNMNLCNALRTIIVIRVASSPGLLSSVWLRLRVNNEPSKTHRPAARQQSSPWSSCGIGLRENRLHQFYH